MSRKKTEATPEDQERAYIHLPIDLHEEILCWLPSNDLLNLKRVCKDWLKLISSPGFIEKHLERSKAASGCNGTRILIPSHRGKIQEYRYAGGNIICSKEFPYSDLRFLGSCDGLILCKLYNNCCKIALINPCTGILETRKPDGLVLMQGGSSICSWFGHHPSTREYVLVLARLEFDKETRPLRLVFQVYSLSGDTINSVSVEQLDGWGNFKSLQCIGTFLHGRLHFPVLRSHIHDGFGIVISGYDFETNKILKMGAPAQSCFTLGVVDGCLSAIHMGAGMFELWVMKEYGVKECWTKYANIEGYDRCRILTPVAYFPNGDVILESDHQFGGTKFSVYSFRDSEIKHFQVYEPYSGKPTAIACIDSLVSPALVWRGME